MEDLGSIPGSGRSPEGRHSNPLQYSCLENPHGHRSLAGYSPWGLRVGKTEHLSTQHNLKPRECVEKQRHYSTNEGPCNFLSGHVQLRKLDHKEGRMPKNWCLWTVVLEKTPESPSDSEEIKPVNIKGDQPWIFTGRTDAEAEAPVFWSSCKRMIHWKSLWCWERLRAEGEEGVRGWDGWMA